MIEVKNQEIHKQIIEDMTAMCRSNKKEFIVDSRIKVIRDYLKNTSYKEYYSQDAPVSLWSKAKIEDLPRDIVLISSHADIVNNISACNSKLTEEGFYKGTYDNIITNAAALILMLEADLPENIVFAFTGDEETGRCNGAKEAASYLYRNKKKPICIALDVTFEGFDENDLCSIENASAPKHIEQEFLNNLVDNFSKAEGEEQTFHFVKLGESHVPSKIEKKYMAKSSGMYDEGMCYKEEGYSALSFCIPCDGSMHSEAGVYIKQPVFEGYLASLYTIASQLVNCNKKEIESLKTFKDECVQKAKEIIYKKPERVTYFRNPNLTLEDLDEKSYQYSWECPYFEKRYNSFANEESLDLSSLDTLLFSEASMYNSSEEDAFVRDCEIPPEYYKHFCSTPDDAILEEEWELMENYVRDIFRQAHGLEREQNNFYINYDDVEEDELPIDYNKVKKSSYSFSDYDEDEDYEGLYSDYTSL